MALTLLAVAVLGLLVLVAECTDPNVDPELAVIPEFGSYTLKCSFPTALTGCQVRVFERRSFDAYLDFGQGNNTPPIPVRYRSGKSAMEARYHGDGLAAGSCGVHLPRVPDGKYVIQCRGRNEVGGWSQRVAILIATAHPTQISSSPTPRTIVAKYGHSVSVLLTTSGSFDECEINTPGFRALRVNNRQPLLPQAGRFRLFGAGRASGECGFTLHNVSASDGGLWVWGGWQGRNMAYQAVIVLVVAPTSGKPDISAVASYNAEAEEDRVVATCTSPPSIPPANLTWRLDGRVLRQDSYNDTLESETAWPLPWVAQSVRQTLNLTLANVERGKQLECHVDFMGVHDKSVLTQNAVPTLMSSSVTKAVPSITSRIPNQPITSDLRSDALAAGCPALVTDTVEVSCELSGTKVDCDIAPVPPGTTATLKCREGYKLPSNHPGPLNTRCTSRRTWNPTPFSCDLDCGRRRGGARLLSLGGMEAAQSEFPWHIAVFQNKHGSFKPICGGSLVTLKYFVSAAHCFWNSSGRKVMDASLYKASAGKHTLAWETVDDGEQRRDIKAIHVEQYYGGSSNRFQADIALLLLSTAVVVTPSVNIVCVDWQSMSEHNQVVPGVLGTVPGWGVYESNTMSPTLRFVDLPFVPHTECRESVPRDFADFLTVDKMCGGYRNRSTGVCPGDSGGGFVFPAYNIFSKTRYFLRGVVSSAPVRRGADRSICYAENMSAFTKISTFDKWLKDTVFSTPSPEED